MFNSLHHKNVSCLAVAGIYPPKHLRRRTATLVSPATCWRGSFLRNCQIHSLSCKSCRNRAQIRNLIMQNKAKLQDAKMNVSNDITKGYENLRPFSRPKNKAKQTQNEPNFSPKLALFLSNEPNFKPNYVKIGNLCQRQVKSVTISTYMCQFAKSIVTSIANPASRILGSYDLCSCVYMPFNGEYLLLFFTKNCYKMPYQKHFFSVASVWSLWQKLWKNMSRIKISLL